MAVRRNNRLFDVRPDRLDLRDREYRPPLTNLPAEYPGPDAMSQLLPLYKELVRNQGREGACTGFGLAAVVNYLQWSRGWRDQAIKSGSPLDQLTVTAATAAQSVSPRMLYHLARMYDEWPGEDYDGSSCRGAMKGWHKHGVCAEPHWPYPISSNGTPRFAPPRPIDGVAWQQDAATRPLGAYYRINKDSVSDMQAALFEVGAIYVSAQVHDGWSLNPSADLPVIKLTNSETGGHAFAIVGYTSAGFIVQNSWGPEWGFQGFAVMRYEDWVRNGMDAWVAVMGAPVAKSESALVQVSADSGRARAGAFFGLFGGDDDPKCEQWCEKTAQHHMLVMGNDGQPLNRLVEMENAAKATQRVCRDEPREWLTSNRKKKVAIYCHGGLNSEAASLKRTQVMGPWFEKNGVYPIFVTWKTGWRETLTQILQDSLPGIPFLSRGRAEGIGDFFRDVRDGIRDLGNATVEATDRALEAACEKLAKPLWSQMKQNAEASADSGMGVDLLAKHLKGLSQDVDGLEVHLVGHSAGSLVIGHLLDDLGAGRNPLGVSSVSLYAPACSMRFANRHYVKAIDKGVVSPDSLKIDILNDANERDDAIGPYRKSLLYLVSRALEIRHKTPLLGMEREWVVPDSDDDLALLWGSTGAAEVRKWRAFVADQGIANPVVLKNTQVSNGVESIQSTHGSFDNNVEVVNRTLRTILGRTASNQVDCLAEF